MNRRRFLAATAVPIAGLSGCVGGPGGGASTRATAGPEPTTRATAEPTTRATAGAEITGTTTGPAGPRHGDDLPGDPDPDDGYPPAFETVPDAPSAEPSSFETTDVNGVPVPLAPIDVTYAWYARGEARFVDARGTGQYERSHVFGAVSSPAASRDPPDDPVADWPTADRIVCYCGCPHHLSSIRAAEFRNDGHGNVFVIDEGFREWDRRSYPMAGANVGASPALVVVDGVVDPAHAGAYALARHPPTGQMEAAPIDADGRYSLALRFSGVGPSSRVVVETPAYEVSAPLRELSGSVVRG